MSGTRAPADEHVAEAPGRVVYGVYRLIKACALYQDSNQAVVRLVRGAVEAVHEYCALFGSDNATVVFVGDAVFVGGDLLRASRETHVIAVELGQMLGKCEVSELSLSKDVTGPAIGELARLVADALSEPSRAARVSAASLKGIRTAKVSGLRAAGRGDAESPVAAALRTFAVAIVTVQNAYSDLRAGEASILRRIKRVAQKIVATLAGEGQPLVALAAGNTAREAAAVAVSGAILAVAAGRQLSSDRVLLTNLAIAALLYDTGQTRLSDRGSGFERSLTDEESDRLPASTAFVMTAMMKLHHPARVRTVLAFEAHALARTGQVGAPYKGYRVATPLARILSAARSFATLRPIGTIDATVRELTDSASDANERMSVKLVVGALGIFPIGTLVELTTGEMGVVLATPDRPMDFVRPRLRVMYDERGNLLDVPLDVDLASPPAGAPLRLVRRAVTADENQERAMREVARVALATTQVETRGAREGSLTPPKPQPSKVPPVEEQQEMAKKRSIPHVIPRTESEDEPLLQARPRSVIPRTEPDEGRPSKKPAAVRRRTELGIPAPAQVNRGRPSADKSEPLGPGVTSTLAWSAGRQAPKDEPSRPPKAPIPREEDPVTSVERRTPRREETKAEETTVRQNETDALLSEFLAQEPSSAEKRKKLEPSTPPRKSEPVATEETAPSRKRDPRSE